jgi:hypothetical protein
MTWQFIPFLVLAAALAYGIYRFAKYLNAKDAAAHVAPAANPNPVEAAPVGGGAVAPEAHAPEAKA